MVIFSLGLGGAGGPMGPHHSGKKSALKAPPFLQNAEKYIQVLGIKYSFTH